jgi:integrase
MTSLNSFCRRQALRQPRSHSISAGNQNFNGKQFDSSFFKAEIMVSLCCTRVVRDRLRLSGPLPPPERPTAKLGNWYVHLGRFGHRQIVLATSERSLLTVLLAASNRRVIGSMNEFVWQLRSYLSRTSDPLELSLQLSETPMSAVGSKSSYGFLLSKAVDWGVLEEHPFRALKPLKTDRTGRVRYLNAAEEVALREALSRREGTLREARTHFNEWRAARGKLPLPPRREPYADHLQPIVLVAMNTGLRRSELFHLRWEDVDFEAKWLTVQGVSAKNGQTRRIPLNAEALSTLETWRTLAKEGEPQVFPGVGGGTLKRVDRAWRRLRKGAKLQNFRFHDLRHHFASRLVQSGVPLNTVRELLGHADTTMVLRYAHLSPDHLAAAVEKVARPNNAQATTLISGNSDNVTPDNHSPAM